ncbi:DUF6274 family protein [Streptomyces collinus]|uniref:Uncharacterized protein n=1 Tax=Streptomyces collinus (strain DSM 40733 / Tue 365) TaxID=1214242 RepID=S5VQ67_STRC3|nr:DUF6274 family protein [Streptomyces collinus]AGS70480.1 hypothetical protein B446_18320 [Streptomyces collinus Tu 365]UJA09123.1 hypothetical protein HGI10_30600 [Streptomyces collinus]UJA16013.1 hypothetical protein HGI09_33520 [Streptomyces collinus]
MAASARHETRALLRAHLSAASSYGHLTRHCPICHRLLRLAMDAAPSPQEAAAGVDAAGAADEAPEALEALETLEGESPGSA